ncbi:MDR family MFS transporter [Streptomyces sp. NPDC059651]|uniref:MDR family MFS transporter n=1 Tax=unclassified Streptomyces TaxID=2593676 RepID=UPI0036D12D81
MTASDTERPDTREAAKAGALVTWREAPAAARMLVIGTFVHRLGSFLQTFLVLYLTHRGFSDGQAGTALGVYGAGMVFGVLVGGWLSDRLSPRTTIVGSTALTALLLPAMLYLHSIGPMLVLVALIGAVGQAYRPASTSALSKLVPESRHVMLFAMVRLATNLGTGIGPVLGAALVMVSYQLLFWGEALATLCFALAAFFALRGGGAGLAHPKGGPAGEEESGSYLEVLRDRRYLMFLCALLTTSAVYIQYVSTLPLAVTAAGLNVMSYGILVGLNGIVVVAFELLVAKRVQHWPRRVAAVAGVVLTAVGVAAYALPWGMAGFVLATAVWSFGETVGYPTLFFAYPAQAGPRRLRGRYLGASNSVYGLGCALGPVIGTAVWSGAGRGLWLWCGALGLVAAIMTWAGVVPAEPEPEE